MAPTLPFPSSEIIVILDDSDDDSQPQVDLPPVKVLDDPSSEESILILDDSDDDSQPLVDLPPAKSLDDIVISDFFANDAAEDDGANTNDDDEAADAMDSNGCIESLDDIFIPTFSNNDDNKHAAGDVVATPEDNEDAVDDDSDSVDSNSGTFLASGSAASSNAARKPRRRYNYWTFSDECRLVETDGRLLEKNKKKYNCFVDVSISKLIKKFKAGGKVFYRGELTYSIVHRKRLYLRGLFLNAVKMGEVKMGDKYKPCDLQQKKLYNCCAAAWPHIIEQARA